MQHGRNRWPSKAARKFIGFTEEGLGSRDRSYKVA